jgi:hypothetical protein
MGNRKNCSQTTGKRMKHPNLNQIIYLAGIIDSKGCIYIANDSCSSANGNPYYQTNIQIIGDELLIDWLVSHIGGRKSSYIAKSKIRTVIHTWICHGDLVTHICNLILPYLVVKKKQCEIMIKMRKTYPLEQKNVQKKPIEPHILEERKKYFEEMSLANSA